MGTKPLDQTHAGIVYCFPWRKMRLKINVLVLGNSQEVVIYGAFIIFPLLLHNQKRAYLVVYISCYSFYGKGLHLLVSKMILTLKTKN